MLYRQFIPPIPGFSALYSPDTVTRIFVRITPLVKRALGRYSSVKINCLRLMTTLVAKVKH
jgi:hypothetical protein